MSSSISVHLTEKGVYTGVLCGDMPSLSKLHHVNLTTPIALTENIITAYSDKLSPKELMKLVTSLEITSASTGILGGEAVLAATVEGVLEQQLQKPMKFIEL